MLLASLYHLLVSESYLGSWPTSKNIFPKGQFVMFNGWSGESESFHKCWVSPHTWVTLPFPSTSDVLGDSTSHLALCLSPLLHPTFSTVPPFRHQAISVLFPTQQICFLEPFPEYFGIHPCPLPICSLVWHRSRGQRGGSEGGGGYTLIVTVPSRCS